jgi:hypothetical protein
VSGKDPTVSVNTKGAVVIRPGKPLPDRFSAFAGNVCPETDFVADASATRVFLPAVIKAPLSARYGKIKVGNDVASRVEIDTAVLLRAAPKRARVVFVLDASHSMAPAGIQRQLDLALAYVEHLPDATVEIVAYRRSAARLFGKFVAAGELDRELANLGKGALEPGNGSELAEGLRAAAAIVRGSRGNVRVIAFTDSRVRKSFRAAAAVKLLARAPKGTIAHLINIPRIHDGPTELDRNQRHPFAAIATSTGGIVVDAHGGEAASARVAMLSLVRPTAIDEFSVEIDGVPRYIGSSDAMAAGEALRLTWVQGRGPKRVVVRGKLWSKSITQRLRVDRALSKELPKLLLGNDARRQLTLEQITKLATAAGVVSERTSLLALDPNVEPNSYDYKDGKLGELSLCGGHGCGSTTATFDRGSQLAAKRAPTRPRPVADYESILRAQLRGQVRSCAAAHASGHWDMYVSVETTLDEVVSVDLGSSDNEQLRSCVEEVVWQLRVDRRLAAEHGTYELIFGTTAGD